MRYSCLPRLAVILGRRDCGSFRDGAQQEERNDDLHAAEVLGHGGERLLEADEIPGNPGIGRRGERAIQVPSINAPSARGPARPDPSARGRGLRLIRRAKGVEGLIVVSRFPQLDATPNELSARSLVSAIEPYGVWFQDLFRLRRRGSPRTPPRMRRSVLGSASRICSTWSRKNTSQRLKLQEDWREFIKLPSS